MLCYLSLSQWRRSFLCRGLYDCNKKSQTGMILKMKQHAIRACNTITSVWCSVIWTLHGEGRNGERSQVRISLRMVVFIATATTIYSLGHGLHAFSAVPRSTQPCIPPRSLNQVPDLAGVKVGMSRLPACQVAVNKVWSHTACELQQQCGNEHWELLYMHITLHGHYTDWVQPTWVCGQIWILHHCLQHQ